jgi:hypothetical protein
MPANREQPAGDGVLIANPSLFTSCTGEVVVKATWRIRPSLRTSNEEELLQPDFEVVEEAMATNSVRSQVILVSILRCWHRTNASRADQVVPVWHKDGGAQVMRQTRFSCFKPCGCSLTPRGRSPGGHPDSNVPDVIQSLLTLEGRNRLDFSDEMILRSQAVAYSH